MNNRTQSRRLGFTLIEMTVSLAVIAVAGAIVAQTLVWSLRERQRLGMQQAAIEIATNMLEEARAAPFEQLNQAWADAQTIPSEVAGVLPNGKLLLTIEPIEGSLQARRIRAEVRWQLEAGTPPRSVALATVLTGRSAKKGGQP